MDYYHHNLDPIAFAWGDFVLPWYWLVYVLGFFLVFYASNQMRQRWKLDFSKNQLIDVMTAAWCGLLLGGRLFYVIFYNFDYFWRSPQEIIAFWRGGMSFHGGFLGAIAGIWIISYKQKKSFFRYTDIFVLSVPIVLVFGRIANFINGELVGRVTDVPWAVVFAKTYDELPRHPSQLYQAFSEGLLLWILLWRFRKKRQTQSFLSTLFVLGYGLARFAVEFFRKADDQLGYYWMGLTMGQLLCGLMIVSSAIWLFLLKTRNPKKQ